MWLVNRRINLLFLTLHTALHIKVLLFLFLHYVLLAPCRIRFLLLFNCIWFIPCRNIFLLLNVTYLNLTIFRLFLKKCETQEGNKHFPDNSKVDFKGIRNFLNLKVFTPFRYLAIEVSSTFPPPFLSFKSESQRLNLLLLYLLTTVSRSPKLIFELSLFYQVMIADNLKIYMNHFIDQSHCLWFDLYMATSIFVRNVGTPDLIL